MKKDYIESLGFKYYEVFERQFKIDPDIVLKLLVEGIKMKTVISIKKIGNRKVCDLTVKDAQHYILKNGVISHNTGAYYSSDAIWIIGRQQDKDASGEINGYNFIINVEKSRHVREKSKIPITISHKGGIIQWSGLMDIALETGHVVKPSNGWYQKVNIETGEVIDPKMRLKDTMTSEFWADILGAESFKTSVENMYSVSNGAILNVEESVNE